MLQGKHITFSYSDSAKGKIDVLKDVSFEIREHDFIGLIGTSGSGKTTLIKHLNGLLKMDEDIFLDDFTLDEVADTLQVPIDIVKSSGQDFVNAILGIDTRRNRDKQNVKDRRIESV